MTRLQTITQQTTDLAYSPESRRAPWNVMGGDLTTERPDVATALAETGLDFTTEVRDLFSARTLQDVEAGPDGVPYIVPGSLIHAPTLRTIVRPMADGTEKVLAATGRRFTPVQNRDAFSVADTLVGEYGSKIVGATDFHGGSGSLMVVNLNRPIRLDLPGGEQDVTDLNLYIKNAHDGSAALTFALSGMRIACTNALSAAIKGAVQTWKMSHTPNVEARMHEAKVAIIRAMTFQDAFQAEAQAMLDTAMVDAEFDKIVSRLWPVDPEAEDTRQGQNRLAIQDEVKALYHESRTLDGIRGTRWGGYNALTEWADWKRPTRGKTEAAKAVARAEGALETTGATARLKSRVWSTFAVHA